MPVMVRNRMPGPTVLTMKDHDPVILESIGDPMGGDVQRVPDSAAEDVNFLKALDAGVISIDEAPAAVQESLQRQRASFESRRAAVTAAAQNSIDRHANNDFMQAECIGPSPTGRGTCGTGVPVRESARSSKPPLCQAHESLAAQYVLIEQIDAPLSEDGKTPSKWSRVGMAATQHDLIG